MSPASNIGVPGTFQHTLSLVLLLDNLQDQYEINEKIIPCAKSQRYDNDMSSPNNDNWHLPKNPQLPNLGRKLFLRSPLPPPKKTNDLKTSMPESKTFWAFVYNQHLWKTIVLVVLVCWLLLDKIEIKTSYDWKRLRPKNASMEHIKIDEVLVGK